MRSFLPVALLMLLGGCAPDMKLDGPWQLGETDTSNDRMLCREIDGACVGDQLPGPQVYGAGWDRNYVVFVKHPIEADGFTPDPTRSEYFYVVRGAGEAEASFAIVLRGPFDEEQFKRETARLKLPPITVWPDY